MTLALGVDVTIALVLAFLFLRGLFRGLSGEVFSLGGIVGGAYLAWRFGPTLTSWYLSRWSGSASVILIISMVLLFVLVVVIASVVCRIVQAFLRWTSLSFIDRVLGGAAGILKGAVLVLFLYALLSAFSSFASPSPQWMQESIAMKTASLAWPYVNSIFHTVEGVNLINEST
ncbi:MAG: CvpA family protein [Aminobacterium sp.]|jgi:membrane protein required for colicin V production|uniref:CvpA family protein n=1 Tax=unclassified Aminobacterium TaxID=2685012 RepID=UPI001BCE30ED|nr:MULTISPECIES: CvpA family protein [unclassified Aminobacterium]MDD2206527.1 CvpA family protein [Aminobacterium sp.]MDD3425939.1 CvpA family protein [Aminobacterium sp.]MDD3707018.1 CvpA family protein [Aminobacterium sp.]MDD4228445.1 CvpA family protein [Aminobacterium sp.]MDD4551368.1 CvpA family protein [Aminobacterium sp.]